MTTHTAAAVDLGASSGRVMLARVGRDRLDITEVHRFGNVPVRLPGGLHWDVLRLYRDVLDGLGQAARACVDGEVLGSIGIDSWAVDYGLLDDTGALLGNPHHYRDGRTSGAAAAVHAKIGERGLYDITGLQYLPFNTIYQLAVDPAAATAAHALLVPDLLTYWLTGSLGTEATNASTTGLLDVRSGDWAAPLFDALGLPPGLFPPLRRPGDVVGPLLPEVLDDTGLAPSAVVTAVGSHDTASAVVGVPAADERFAYISCGTWSLVGVELDAPVLTPAGRAANFTNEGGVDGTVRYLRNVMGLWLLSESIATWNRTGPPADLPALLAAAADVPAGGPVFDPDDPVFLPPGDQPARIADALRRAGERVPSSRAELVRCILDSLAAAYARTVREASGLSGCPVDVVHLVGGGARNELLCRLTADACELPVLAGPVEATALGNVLVQARAHGAVAGDRWALRELLRSTQPTTRYEPSSM
ncbi:rhamnulokinase [Jiangella alkaliphila]|uniref:Rhamnulokinase n=1 Tax=Jiangella alkaliphila TaxID=419479 RepID=A0A1H2GI96_9ACTN|nr:rhamnulokinase family protein [Jiangella alkaliphila]SDU19446.1 rhamnulokinase [Jiangella alkaliphila]